MTGHTTTATGHVEDEQRQVERRRDRRIDDAFGPGVTPPHRPRPLAALGVGESAEVGGESVALGAHERSVEGEQRPGRLAVAGSETGSTDRSAPRTEGSRTSPFIVGTGRVL
jgi:hypothetical protein